MTIPLITRTKGGIVVIRWLVCLGHDCDGEEVILRLEGRNEGRVLYADRCTLAPQSGCDGIPYFLRGDVVRLPAGWHPRDHRRLDLSDLHVVNRVGEME